mmetsp:Transcript_17949/g.41048  ORF Transcript_17949/g.41048 Transcript_17949/m.41048 type:complete len:82 (+) Transcript_17949:441-686(+)
MVFVAEGCKPKTPFHKTSRGSLSAHPIATCWTPSIRNGLLVLLKLNLGFVIETNDLVSLAIRLLDEEKTFVMNRGENMLAR